MTGEIPSNVHKTSC